MEDCKGQEGCDDCGYRERSPEKARKLLVEGTAARELIIPQTDWKLAGSVEIREPQHDIWNESTLSRN